MKTEFNHQTKKGNNLKNLFKSLVLFSIASFNAYSQNETTEQGIWVTVQNPNIIAKQNGKLISTDAKVQISRKI